jgi:ribosomal-protein-alanine N-acetyltransferase
MDARFVRRPLGALDLDHAAGLHRQAFEPIGERPWTRQDMAELLASPGVAGVFLQADGEDAGFALWRVVEDEAELLTIAVEGGRRRQGIGRTLLGWVVEGARGQGAQTLFLEVGVDNAAARSLYTQVGFAEVGRRSLYYRRGEGFTDALVLRLAL